MMNAQKAEHHHQRDSLELELFEVRCESDDCLSMSEAAATPKSELCASASGAVTNGGKSQPQQHSKIARRATPEITDDDDDLDDDDQDVLEQHRHQRAAARAKTAAVAAAIAAAEADEDDEDEEEVSAGGLGCAGGARRKRKKLRRRKKSSSGGSGGSSRRGSAKQHKRQDSTASSACCLAGLTSSSTSSSAAGAYPRDLGSVSSSRGHHHHHHQHHQPQQQQQRHQRRSLSAQAGCSFRDSGLEEVCSGEAPLYSSKRDSASSSIGAASGAGLAAAGSSSFTAGCAATQTSSATAGAASGARHSRLRNSLLSVLGKLVVWKGTRYRPTPTSSSSIPPSSPPPTECIGRSGGFFSSGDDSRKTERRIRANNREYNLQFNYANNYIKTSKYSVLTFLPLNLFEQFQRLANFYFLCLLVLQLIPAISSLTPVTTAIPLIGVLTLTAVKDAYDDFQRHSSDSQVNNRKSWTLRGTKLREEKWSQVQVGDVIRMENDQFVAADVLLLTTSEPNGLCYIETAELDGETNLKCRQCLQETAEMMDNHELIGNFDGEIICETPNNLLNKFDGILTWKGKKYILDNDKVILRGCVLRNTQWCYGIVIFAGKDTKLMQNSGKSKFKRTSIDRLLNLLIIGIVLFLLSLCLFCMIGCGIWESLVGRYFQVYLPWDSLVPSEPLAGATVIALLVFFSYAIVLNTVVPISLYVSVEVIRFVQSFLINWDEEMYHAPTNTHARARTTTLNEELGQIQYIFSDKTGTLTQNIMTFNKCSIAGQCYGDVIDEVTGEVIDLTEIRTTADKSTATSTTAIPSAMPSVAATMKWKNGQDFVRPVYTQLSGPNDRLLDHHQQKQQVKSATLPAGILNGSSNPILKNPMRRSTVPSLDFSFNKDYEPEFKFYDSSLLEAVRSDNEDVHSFFRLLALCHTVMAEDKTGNLEYQAQSPDEAALVSAARNFGFVFRERSPNSITIDVMGKREIYELLCILDFNNVRKRMSVILRKDGQLKLYCKGADNVIYERVKAGSEEIMAKTQEHLNKFAGEGLRTLCLSTKDLDEAFFNDWKQRHQEAAMSHENKDDKLDAIYEEIEKDMTLLGATAIEDKLQDGVPQTIANLGLAGIKLWVLTGDKQETAINIGYSCQLLTDDLTDVFIVDATTYDGVETQLTRYLDTIKASSNQQKRPTLSIVTFSSDTEYNQTREEADEHDNDTQAGFAIVINGHSLVHALHPQMEQLFMDVSSQCKAVICCRVTPLQKAMVVELVKKNKEAVTLAIGDGANDVSMIKTAHIGVGISGQEGLQAVLASDYSIGQFRFLERLLMVHGRWSYYRMSKFLRYFFYKNFAFTLCHIWFAFFCGFSAQTVFDPMYISVYNLFYTSLPVLAVGIFDQDVNDKNSLMYPKLYTPGHQNLLFNKKEFCWSALHGFFASCVLFLVPYGTYKDGVSPKGYVLSDHMLLGSVVATILVIVVTVQIALDTSYWTIINHFMVWGSLIWYFILDYFYNFVIGGSYVGSLTMAMSEATFWFTAVISVIMLVIPVLSWRFFFIDVRPTLSDRVRLKQRLAQMRSRQSQDILRTPSTRRTRRSLRSGYAFAHQEGFGRLITSGKIMRKLPNGSDFKFAMPFASSNNVPKQVTTTGTTPGTVVGSAIGGGSSSSTAPTSSSSPKENNSISQSRITRTSESSNL
ncbi:probable phospholipid-transporting ATPase IM isoform X2 [Trichogramma pretiosum]|uniref:probable phospholipid-transporting ATPase IM isoform X2 n=1 Tax=Trichogramma pretiosum TaxID=7493 RepID=UPI000C71ACAF|nr:probable phospholipid-transporting ATPase IM isoform X2 [Trichogramma pretiosum]